MTLEEITDEISDICASTQQPGGAIPAVALWVVEQMFSRDSRIVILEAENNRLMKDKREIEANLAAITMGIRNEFTTGALSGDVLQDFASFIDHHATVEKELNVTKRLLVEKNETADTFMNQVKRFHAELLESRRETQEWKDILARRDKHIVDQNSEIVSLKTKRDELRNALIPFTPGVDFISWGKIKAHLPTELAKQLTGLNIKAAQAISNPAKPCA